ncbi:aminoglycoside phosphotransferase family protein [Enterococcus raffinosus]|uniref:aminoglycoside phosphotransferase family protein n=1 Tax=Enterococcus raffinosus TaxID=71452 RepID=UPI001C0FFB4E|nr:aminoglycoside phosphotransferase family protein [Enterococcus raffinosus]MBU5359606.1 aminoglycoside phosphotransferase family protein [Enterococcus raffinosus]
MEAVMILNTKKIPMEMQKRFGDIYPSMLPFKNESIGEYLVQTYSNKDYIFMVSNQEQAPDKNVRLLKKSERNYELFLTDQESSSLLKVAQHALTQMLPLIGQDFEVIINFGDTVVQETAPLSVKNYLLTGEKEQLGPWTSVVRENEQLTFSHKHASSDQKEGEVVAGVFGLQSGKNFLTSCKAVDDNEMTDDSLSFYHAITYYDEKFEQVALSFTDSWLDLGHEAEYLETKKIVQARFFNAITIDDQRGILTKSSEERQKLINEIQWYLKMPPSLQYLTPRIYDYSLEPTKPEVKMEYYPYETLHTLYIYGNLELNDWEKIIEKMLFVRKEMSECSEAQSLALEEKDLLDIYFQKTIDRLKLLLQDPAFKPFYEQAPEINGETYLPLKTIIENLETVLGQIGLLDAKTARVIHGDFCLSNILLDRESHLIKLIDPRGQFGSFDIYGDEFYDIAKILHSFEGSYDHIITDNFELNEATDTSYTYHFEKSELQENITKLVNQKVGEHYEIQQIRLIEGLLFLSMIPLHKDYPKRQKVMFGQAMKILKPYFEEVESVKFTRISKNEIQLPL